jgi:hypothetical protein
MSRGRNLSVEHPDDRPTVVELLGVIAHELRRLADAVEARELREAARERECA